MFRSPRSLSSLRRFGQCPFPRGPQTLRRHAGTSTNSNIRSTGSSKPLWTTSRVLLVTAFVGSLTYTYGVLDASHNVGGVWKTHSAPRYGTDKDMKKAIGELQKDLGEDAISTDEDDCKEHGYSIYSSINIDESPIAVAYPKTTEEVSQIAKICTRYRIPMIPYSGGSSVEGNFTAPFGGICIDFAYMDQVLAINVDDMDVIVQPSVHWMELNEKLKHTGLFFPVDPGPSAKIGGMIGTNCSGTNAFRYGTMKDWVINLTVVLADGRIVKTRRRPRKSAAGYNLTGMFVGAEGTLGLVTEATLKLAVIPQETRVGVIAFQSIRDAVTMAREVIRAGVPVAAMELLDDSTMNILNRAGAFKRVWSEKPTLFFKFSGTRAGIEDNIKLTAKIATANNAFDTVFAKDEEEGTELWRARKEFLWSMMSIRKPGTEIWTTDVAVPISRLPDIVEISKREMDAMGLFSNIIGHIGDGNFHEGIIYDRQNPRERAMVEEAVEKMVNRALEMEGTITGEHAVGLGKKKSLVKELGPDAISIMQAIKRSLDPLWIMNPGKIFDAENIAASKDDPVAATSAHWDQLKK